jgi:Molybdopterin-binding domain of aldehyde dehydrogenase
MVADWLGIAEDKIQLLQADTDEVAVGRGTYASRSMMIGGSALRAAADDVIDKGKRFAAHFMEADAADIAFADGEFRIAGTDRAMPLEQVAQMSFIPVGLPSELGVGLQGAGGFNSDLPTFPNGCHICEVEIDPDTGLATIERYTVVDDRGTVINPLLAKGQIMGVIAQGGGPGVARRCRLRPRRPAIDRHLDRLRIAARRHLAGHQYRFQPGAEPDQPARRQRSRGGGHGRLDPNSRQRGRRRARALRRHRRADAGHLRAHLARHP